MRIAKHLYFKSENNMHVTALNFLNMITKKQADFVSTLICKYLDFIGLDGNMTKEDVKKARDFILGNEILQKNEFCLKNIDFDNLTLKQYNYLIEKIGENGGQLLCQNLDKQLTENDDNINRQEMVGSEIEIPKGNSGKWESEEELMPKNEYEMFDEHEEDDDVQLDEELAEGMSIFY